MRIGARDARAINPRVEVVALPERVAGEQAAARSWPPHDVVLDGSDNFATRHAVNRACVASSANRWSRAPASASTGRLRSSTCATPTAPCYACLFPEDGETEDMRCAVMGVFAPLIGIIGTMQAAEALKLLTGAGETLAGGCCCSMR